MPVIVKQPAPDLPYSLHDAYILEVRLEGDTLHLVEGLCCLHIAVLGDQPQGIPLQPHLQNIGVVETTEPFDQVQGDVEITGVDWDSSHAYVMEYRGVLCGNRGPFTGRKMAVEDFLKTYPQGTLDIMDETYGYRQVRLDGFLNLTGRCLEFRLELYYSGEFRYLLKEPAPGAAV